jgi:uncharacterized protein
MQFLEMTGIGLAGIVVGLISVTAGGGSLVGIPLLMVLGLNPSVAIATSKFSIIGSFVTGSITYSKEGMMENQSLVLMGLVAFAGSVIGSNLVFAIEMQTLKIIVVSLLCIVLGITCFGSKLQTIPDMPQSVSMRTKTLGLGMIFLLSVYSGFFGAGFGTFLVLTLIHIFKLNLIRSAALMSLISLIVVGASVLIFAIRGGINYSVGIPLAIGSTIGGLLGARFAVIKGSRLIKPLFIVMTTALILKLLKDILQEI